MVDCLCMQEINDGVPIMFPVLKLINRICFNKFLSGPNPIGHPWFPRLMCPYLY